MAHDAEFFDGFDKYNDGASTGVGITTSMLAGEWTSILKTPTVAAALIGEGWAVRLDNGGSGGDCRMKRDFPANYERCIGGVWMQSLPSRASSAQSNGVIFWDGGSAQAQIRLTIDGHIIFMRGGTTIVTSTETVADDTINCIEWDITFHNSTGIAKIWLNGVLTSIDYAGDTCGTANNYFNAFNLNVIGSFSNVAIFDHLYLRLFLASGGAETPLGCPLVETQFPISDDAVAFTPGPGILGPSWRTTTSTAAPGANRLVLRTYTPDTDCDMESVAFVANSTSATAKFTPAVYADNAGAPGALLATGPEVVGCTAGVAAVLALTAPEALTDGTPVWIGYLTDVSVTLRLHDATALGHSAASTYASGVPDPAPAMTSGVGSWIIFGITSGSAENFAQVDQGFPVDDLSYNSSDVVDDEDLYGFPSLVTPPQTVHSVAVKARVAKDDAGARTVDVLTKSGAVTSAGDTTGAVLAVDYAWAASYFSTNPNGAIPWGAGSVNAAKHGLKIAS